MKRIIVLAILSSLPLTGIAENRVVVYEIGTGTWCQFCPAAAKAADRMHQDHYGQVLILEYHDDGFGNPDSDARLHYYYITSFPNSFIDGIINHSGGSGCWYAFEQAFLTRQEIPPPLEIHLDRTYEETYLGSGTVTATIINVSPVEVSGKAHFTITESHIPHHWQTEDSLHFVVRDMLPDSSGEEIIMQPGDSLVLEREFIIDPSWTSTTADPFNFELGCFVQKGNKEIAQAAVLPLLGPVSSEVVLSEIDNDDGILHVNESADFYVTLKNTSGWDWEEINGILSTNDTRILIPDDSAKWIDVGNQEQARNDDPFRIKLRNGEDGYLPEFTLILDDGRGHPQELDFRTYEPVAAGETRPFFRIEIPSILNAEGLIALTVSHPTKAEITLFDASGRKVKVVYQGSLSQGLNLIPLTSNSLPEGLYFIRLTCAGEKKIKKVLVLN